jgi:putative nucleotidyltransferase-like protein
MWTMAVDAVTAEVTAALGEAGVDSIVLKGPAIATWLYDENNCRSYVDSDLLVDPAHLNATYVLLEKRGFHREFGPLPHPGMDDPPSHPWRRGAVLVDLHETLPGATADRRHVWAVLRGGSTELSIGGRPTRVLGEPARLVHLALHAAHHGARVEPPLRDLRRALELRSDDDWAAAAAVAERIGASTAFATGLGLLPDGRRLLSRLDLEDIGPAESPSGAEEVRLASGIERLSAARGLRAKAAMLGGELFPSPEFMRWWIPLARRSRRGLLAAYVWRLIYLVRYAPPALRARRMRPTATRNRVPDARVNGRPE